jgi:diaminopimelate decarboxylase
MFTSNNTTDDEFDAAFADEGCILNLDDVSFLSRIASRPVMPKLICFRLNPGFLKTGDEVNAIIGNPVEAKYGVPYEQILDAYQQAKKAQVKEFGLHTMVCSNTKKHDYVVNTVRLLLDIAKEIEDDELTKGIRMSFINMGGGIGIPYKPEDLTFDIEALGRACAELLDSFQRDRHYKPALYMESGRWMTGPHGVLVNTAINHKDGYQQHVGVQIAMPALMRPAMYKENGYHHVTVLDPSGSEKRGKVVKVNIVGPICEDCDRLATDRYLPRITTGDFIVTHDTGAHGIAMGFNYNGRTRPQELMLRANGDVELIRRAENLNDLRATLNFEPKTLPLK